MVGRAGWMSGYWYWQSDERLLGPFTAVEFDRLSQAGHIRSGDPVWHHTWSSWQPYGHNPLEPPPVPSVVSHVPPLFSVRISKLLADHLDKIGIPRHKQTQYQYAVILNELLQSALDNKNSRFSSIRLADEKAFYSAVSLLHDLVIACSKCKSDSFFHVIKQEQYKCIWRHRDLEKAFAEGIGSVEACPPPDVFTKVTERYLGQDLYSETFEWILVDATVASEAYWLGEEIKREPSQFAGGFSWRPLAHDMEDIADYNVSKGNANKLFWLRLRRHFYESFVFSFSLLVISLSALIWADINDLAELRNIAALIFGLASIFVLISVAQGLWAFIRALLGIKPEGKMKGALKLRRKMLAAYRKLEGGIATNPRGIRSVLAKIVRGGAGWNPNVFPLLDRVIQRSASRWS
jgi:hypothetical protein